jgi:3-dehydroquinate synthase
MGHGMNHIIKVAREQSCRLHVDVDSIRSLLEDHPAPERLYFVADEVVAASLIERCESLGLVVDGRISTIGGGERAKTIQSYVGVVSDLESANVLRRDSLVCVGGCTVSDLGGFVAATYLRGIDYVNVPTTVMAQVDGSFGGKVALNSRRGKNVLGAFWHPTDVYVDHSWLASLPAREIAHGFAESVKVACLDGTGHLLAAIEAVVDRLTVDPGHAGQEVVRLSLLTKMRLLESDPFEADLRRLLNLGHTIAHPLETATGYGGVHHGAAVSIGIATACRYGVHVGQSSPEYAERVIRLLSRLGLPTSVDVAEAKRVMGLMTSIRRVRDGALHFVVPVDVGRAVIVPEVERTRLYHAMIGA